MCVCFYGAFNCTCQCSVEEFVKGHMAELALFLILLNIFAITLNIFRAFKLSVYHYSNGMIVYLASFIIWL